MVEDWAKSGLRNAVTGAQAVWGGSGPWDWGLGPAAGSLSQLTPSQTLLGAHQRVPWLKPWILAEARPW